MLPGIGVGSVATIVDTSSVTDKAVAFPDMALSKTVSFATLADSS